MTPLQLIQETSLQHIDKELGSSNLGLFPYSMEGKTLESYDLSTEHELLQVLGQFDDIFQVLTKLPPHRAHDHHIPLVQGAKPLNIRPYHYSPL